MLTNSVLKSTPWLGELLMTRNQDLHLSGRIGKVVLGTRAMVNNQHDMLRAADPCAAAMQPTTHSPVPAGPRPPTGLVEAGRRELQAQQQVEQRHLGRARGKGGHEGEGGHGHCVCGRRPHQHAAAVGPAQARCRG